MRPSLAISTELVVPDAERLPRRPLRVEVRDTRPFRAGDGVELRLTRYQGGDKGPVILSHGLGVSSLIFSIDTIETNLVEYLCEHDYDVWALDHRASIDLVAAESPSNADDVATKDYPAAVESVRSWTGASSVQMVAHCYGSTTFLMAMLAGLEGVRAAVCSQVGTHMVAPTVTRLKSGLHLPAVLRAIGIDSLTAYVGAHADWRERLFDMALRLQPMEQAQRCGNPVCNRITFMYAPLYEHARLNDATHNALGEMFGIATMEAFDHLAVMVRAGHLVSADGRDVYLPHLARLGIPITFIHGEKNACFLPGSTAKTVEALSRKNGPELYERHVIPGYGHIDCIFGKNAAADVYPLILRHLDRAEA